MKDLEQTGRSATPTAIKVGLALLISVAVMFFALGYLLALALN